MGRFLLNAGTQLVWASFGGQPVRECGYEKMKQKEKTLGIVATCHRDEGIAGEELGKHLQSMELEKRGGVTLYY